jgi:hypothetical protein
MKDLVTNHWREVLSLLTSSTISLLGLFLRSRMAVEKSFLADLRQGRDHVHDDVRRKMQPRQTKTTYITTPPEIGSGGRAISPLPAPAVFRSSSHKLTPLQDCLTTGQPLLLLR